MVNRTMTKGELLEKIETAHRQLERYVFYFEKDPQGKFSAGKRPKFGEEEMLQSGVWGDWSLKDLLEYIIHSERSLTALLDGRIGGSFASPLLFTISWDERLDPDVLPEAIGVAGLNEVLATFPDSYMALMARIQGLPEIVLFRGGMYAWTGKHTAADYVQLLTSELYDWVKDLVRRWKMRHTGEQLNKEVILERIRSERQRLEKNLEGIAHEEMILSGVVGEWSLKDLLAHLVEWECMFMGWYQAGLRGEIADIPATGYSWKDMDALNEHIYQKHRERPLEEILEDFGSSYQKTYSLVENMTEEEMFARGRYAWLGKGNLVSYILANTASHYRWAKDRVRAWRKGEMKLISREGDTSLSSSI